VATRTDGEKALEACMIHILVNAILRKKDTHTHCEKKASKISNTFVPQNVDGAKGNKSSQSYQ